MPRTFWSSTTPQLICEYQIKFFLLTILREAKGNRDVCGQAKGSSHERNISRQLIFYSPQRDVSYSIEPSPRLAKVYLAYSRCNGVEQT